MTATRKEKKTSETSFLKIDEGNLDREWEKQPELYHDWALRLADARLEEEECKQALELAEVEAYEKISKDPDRYELSKTTEKAFNNAVALRPTVKRAKKQLAKARYAVNTTQAVVNSLEHKKRALTNLVMLHGQDYFSTPSAPENSVKKAKASTRSKRMQIDRSQGD